MKRKEKPPQPPPSAIISSVAEFWAPVDNCEWRVDKWEFMAAEIPELKREDLPEFHAWVRTAGERQWTVCRRLFGIAPKLLPLSANIDEYAALTKKELGKKLDVDEASVTAEIAAIRDAWRRKKKMDQVEIEGAKKLNNKLPDKAIIAQPTEEEDDELLLRMGFPPSIFELPTREKKENTLEKAWFCKRIREWEPLFTKSTMTEQLAKDTLNNELRLRRENQALWAIDRETSQGSAAKAAREKRKRTVSDRIRELQTLHADQLREITEHAPWFNVSEQQVSVTGAIAQLVQGFQEWEARADSKILDGVFTSTELQVLLRTSKQIDEPRYRWGWVQFVNESRKWLWDPNAKSWMTEKDLAKFDAGFKEGIKRFNESSEERIPDLEADGPESNYADLKLPEKAAA